MEALYRTPLDLLFWGLALAWAAYTLTRVFAVRAVSRLPPADALPDEVTRRVSVIVTARDEERRIDETVRRLLAQSDVDLELVVVDDRSTDATPRILAALAGEFPQIRHVRVDALPGGWLGKTHACQVGAEAATSDWLLFTDADVWMRPDLVARALAVAGGDGVEHLCLLPREHRPNAFSRAMHIAAAVMFAPVTVRMNRGARGAFAGVGAFNLVRADAYRAVGGHGKLRLAIVDDLELGLALYRAGYHSRVFEAFDDLSVEWAPTLRGWVRALEKNLFAVIGFSVPIALLALLALAIGWGGAVAGAFTGRPSGIAAALALLATSLPGLGIARRGGFGALSAFGSPFVLPTLIVAVANSAIKTLARGGVEWRGTFYPLSDLAPGGVWRVAPPGFREMLFAPKPPRPPGH